MARRTITRLTAAAVVAALSLGASAMPDQARDGLDTAGLANGKAASTDGGVSTQGIAWK